MDLFESRAQELLAARGPLAARARPNRLEDFVGQSHLLAPGRLLHGLMASRKPFSAVLAGPPGTGKTTLARLIAAGAGAELVSLNAVVDKVADVRRELEAARERLGRESRATILFIDEVHRFSRSQQDVLLPALESGVVHLLATTTENPNASLTAPLLSRLAVFHFRALSVAEVVGLLRRGLALLEGERAPGFAPSDEELGSLARAVSGDVRQALTLLEVAARAGGALCPERIRELSDASYREYDREGDQHFDTISAFIKSVRGSDPDAALYWLARMLKGGEDPRFVARRLLILASEDIGNADPQGLVLAVAAAEAVERIGMPEGRIVLAQVTTYLSLAPKSNAAYLGIDRAMEAVEKSPRWTVPLPLVNRKAKGAPEGAPYAYPHDAPDGFVAQAYLPRPVRIYRPKAIGAEARLRERVMELDARRREAGLEVAGWDPEA